MPQSTKAAQQTAEQIAVKRENYEQDFWQKAKTIQVQLVTLSIFSGSFSATRNPKSGTKASFETPVGGAFHVSCPKSGASRFDKGDGIWVLGVG